METKSKEAAQQSQEDQKSVLDMGRHDLEQGREGQSKHITDSAEATAWDEAFLVKFSPDDAENPLNWSKNLKWGVTAAVSGTSFIRIMVSTMMAPAINTIAHELNMSTTESTMSLSVYLLATVFRPLIISPISENLICSFANSKDLLISARLLAGFGASAVYSLGYGVLGDIWSAEQRGRSLSLYLLIPLTGSAVGPIVASFIVKYSTWRWMFWATTTLQVALELSSLLLFHESYAPVLLYQRAKKLRKETGDTRYHAEIEIRESGRSTAWKLRRSLSRPLRLLAILEGINYGLLYFALASFSALYVSVYGESVAISGLHYISICIGTISGSQISGPLMDYAYKRLTSHTGDTNVPELRIPLLLPGALFTPIGFLLYGWAAQYHLFWLVIDIGAAILSLGMQIFDTTLSAYVMDAYPEHIGSAAAATQVLRSLLAFAFPLFSDKLYKSLQYGWGNSLLAFLSVGITLPATGVLWRYGAKLRERGKSSY